MSKVSHRGHVEIGGIQLGATLEVEPGRVALEVASTSDNPNMPARLDLARFTSNTGYFTVIDLFRINHNMRLGLAGLSTYIGGLAFESAHFEHRSQIKSRHWSMYLQDIARILHVNGVVQQMIFSEDNGLIFNFTVASPTPVIIECPTVGIRLNLGQDIMTGGNVIDGPTLKLSYPTDIIFADEVDFDTALINMHRIRQFFSLLMGRVLPISSAFLKDTAENKKPQIAIHGLSTTDISDKPAIPIFSVSADLLQTLLDTWLTRYDELEEATHLHFSGLEQRKLPTELRFQIFVQALEALHRRTGLNPAVSIEIAPIISTLRKKGIPDDMIDRVANMLAHIHEPGLRQRLKHYWEQFKPEIATLRPNECRKSFINRVVSTRNYYAHRTDRDDQVFDAGDLWDATETIKSMSHMAILTEVGADIKGVGKSMLDRQFVSYSLRN